MTYGCRARACPDVVTRAGATPAPWWLVLGKGAMYPVAALVLLTQPGSDHLLTLLALLAVCWLAAAALDLADLWRDRRAWGWKLAGAAAAAAAAAVVLRQPLWSTLLVPAALLAPTGMFAAALGAIDLLRAVAGAGWGLAALGALDLVLGVLLLTTPSPAALWAATAWALIAGTGVLAAAIRLRRTGGRLVREARRGRELAG